MSYAKMARFYDAIYSGLDYETHAAKVIELVRSHCPAAASLLDVACGTGVHLSLFRREFDVEGLDLGDEMLEVARQRLPDVALHRGDMRTFDLGRTFDVVTCLFSSIGYMKDHMELNLAIGRMAAHMRMPGVLILEPWILPENWDPSPEVHHTWIDQPNLKIARMNLGKPPRDGRFTELEMHHLVGTSDGIEYFLETHELTLFTHEEYMEAFRTAGLIVEFHQEALWGRGVYVGQFAGYRN